MSKKLFSRKQVRNISIEFAKYLMGTNVTIDGEDEFNPPIFAMLYDELDVNGKKLFSCFIEDKANEYAQI